MKRLELIRTLEKTGFKRNSYENQRGAYCYWLDASKSRLATRELNRKAAFESIFKAVYTFDRSARMSLDPLNYYKIFSEMYEISEQGASIHVRFHKCLEDKMGIDI